MWNNLPNEIQIIPNLALFKNKIKTHFPGNPGNSISPYSLFESHDGFFGKLLTQMSSDVSLALVLGPCLSLRTDPQVLGLGLGLELQVLGLGLGLDTQVLDLGLGLDTQVLGKFQGPRTCVKDLCLDNSSSSRSFFHFSILKKWLKLNNIFFFIPNPGVQKIFDFCFNL